jgi:alkylation response protein AidB-like acyl-CoA dehydrogenase
MEVYLWHGHSTRNCIFICINLDKISDSFKHQRKRNQFKVAINHIFKAGTFFAYYSKRRSTRAKPIKRVNKEEKKMDFKKTDEQELLLESVREFFERNTSEEKVQQWVKDHDAPVELTKGYLDAGFGFLGLPEEYGGTPVDRLTMVLLIEEVHRRAAVTTPFVLNSVAMFDICEFGSREQVEFCMDIYNKTGKPCFAMAISEPGAGSDNSAMATTAKKVDGKIILNGQKTWVTNGEHTPYLLIFAKDEDPSPQNRSISMWLIPKNLPGVSTSGLGKIGQTMTPFCDVYFDNVVIEESCLVGERGKGFINLMKNFEFERLLGSAQSLGLAQAAMDDAAAYASQRVQFGQSIGKFQLIQEKLTDMEIKLQTIRNFLYKTAWELDNGIPVQLTSALVKRYAGKTATEVCSEAMQIFGGLGYTTETRVGRLWQDCRGNQIAAGTDEIMVHIAGRQLLKKYAK